MFSTIFNIAANAMSANRLRINTIASNIANAETTRTEDGGPYKRRDVVFAATDVPGVGQKRPGGCGDDG
jgi:flagellar basal-body rod protein FlgC